MEAPNPTATSEVWRYTLNYALGGSQRSLLASVQRCENVSGCLWAKQFTYAPSTTGAVFQSQPIVPAPIPKSDYDFGEDSAPEGEAPAMQTLDLNGDAAADVLFGTGVSMLWGEKHYLPPVDRDVPDGKFLGTSHTLWLSGRDASGSIVPFAQSLTLARDEEPLATANYGHVRLDQATVVDLDGDGRDELVATIDNIGTHETDVDPKLPPLYRCSYADLKWTNAGFVHINAVPCTLLGVTQGIFRYYMPGEFPTFADFDGDGLPDRAWLFNKAGWIGSNNQNSNVQYEYDPAWKIAFNMRGLAGSFGPPVQLAQFEASPGVVTDLNGDGRAELTSDALRSSLTFDDNLQWIKQTPDSIHQPEIPNTEPFQGYREFGDFNGDGTEDMLRLTIFDSSRRGEMTAQIFWNTGKGFYADRHSRSVAVDVHPDVALNLPTRFTDPGIHVTDLDNDGRMDVVVFNNDHRDANNQPAPQIEFLFSQGDGTFGEVDVPMSQAGTRDDVKYWIDNSARPIWVYPGRLEFDQARIGLMAFGQLIPAAQVLLSALPFEDYIVVGGDGRTPGLAAGWNLATLADTNGDGFVDIVRHVGGNDPAGGIEVLQQTPAWGDELTAVTDAATAWPALSIDYSSEWSDRPEVNDSYTCMYPLSCPRNGLRVVRAVTSRAGLTDLDINDKPLDLGRRWEYAYRDPIVNRQGLGFLGFSEMRVWDTAPEHPVETITTFDLRTPDASGKIYPGVGIPATVTIAQPILDRDAGQPASATARLTKTTQSYELRMLNGGATHAVFPQATQTSQWEEPVTIAWSGDGPDHLHISGYAEPADPPIHVKTQFTVDDYGNVTDAVTRTAKGLTTDVQTQRLNDTVNWHLGFVSERSAMTLESAKNAVPVWQTTDYTYTSKGQIDTITVEPHSQDPSLQSMTAFKYDDYGLLTNTTTTVAGEAPRTTHLEYTNAWPGAPDEHLFPSKTWAEHANPICIVDCRPAMWLLTHPAYGLPIAAMDVNGVETVRVYDGHGRPVQTATDGALPISVTYAGRPDAFGGMNGLESIATSGSQQVLKTFDARGAELRTSFVGFDGSWINVFSEYDALGRRTAVSRPTTGVPTAWTTAALDSLGRTVAIEYPDGSATASVYGLLEAEHTDPAGHYSYQNYDVDGRLITSGTELPPVPGCKPCFDDDVKTTYQYTATHVGAVVAVTDPQGNVATTQYDLRERPVQETDPSTGTTQVTYNGFGERKVTLHVANGDTETGTYDDLGRVITTTTPEGLTTYTWDAAVNGIGRLARATSPDQIGTRYRYDTLGRTIGIDQADETNEILSLDFQFDPSTGRLTSIDYPQVPGQTERLRAAYAYNAYGYLTSVSDGTPGHSGTVWQQITARNADLALVDALRGVDGGAAGAAIADHRDYDPLMGRVWTISAAHAGANRLTVGYNYDADGLVNQRTTTDDAVQIDEMFEHDALHRLTHATRDGMPLQVGLPFSVSTDETYDSVGNRIDTLRGGQLVEHRNYGNNGQQPYALTERDVTAPVPQVLSYEYDALGRLKHDSHRDFVWTSFDLPSSVTQDAQTYTFRYDADHVRVKKIGPDETVRTFAGLYEKHSASAKRDVFRIVGSDQSVADITYTEAAQPSQPGTTTASYPLGDALGSTDAVADASGTIAEHDYYDAWGQRSNPDETPLANATPFQSLVSAGFTGQEHDDDLAMINMQGRLYDAALGRFLSADPIVGNGAFSQSWNAYSYVNNSPLNFTDPSGFDPCPPGLVCETGPGNEITNTIQYGYGGESFGGDALGSVGNAGQLGYGGLAYSLIGDLARFAQQQHQLTDPQGHRLLDGTPVRAADGTPILPRRINARDGNRLESNWGQPIRGNTIGPLRGSGAGAPSNGDGLLTRKASSFSVRLFCGTKCSEASAPASKLQADQAPTQLSNARIARNSLSQALAAKAVVRWVWKIGVVIDEGIEGVIDRLSPDGLAVSDDEKKVLAYLAEKEAERTRLIEEAQKSYDDALQRSTIAIALRDKLERQATAAAFDLDQVDPSATEYELVEKVYLEALSEYTKAEREAARASSAKVRAEDWLERLQAPEE